MLFSSAPTSLQRSFFNVAVFSSLVAAQLLVQKTSAPQKSECCSATSAAQLSENCSTTSVVARGMLQGWGLEGWGLGLADLIRTRFDLILTRFEPEKADFGSESGQNPGQNQVRGRGLGGGRVQTGKSHPWTNTSAGGNFRTFRTIGPYEFPQEKVGTNDWSI